MIALLPLSTPVAGADEGDWHTATDSDCQVWNPSPQLKERISWTGDCLDGKASGVGVITWRYEQYGRALEDRYEGTMADGRLNGDGLFVSSHGVQLRGRFVDGSVEGHGTLEWPNGNRYEGGFTKGLRHGTGTFVWFDGDRYEGPWVAGKKHGKGVCRRPAAENTEPCCYRWDRPVRCPAGEQKSASTQR